MEDYADSDNEFYYNEEEEDDDDNSLNSIQDVNNHVFFSHPSGSSIKVFFSLSIVYFLLGLIFIYLSYFVVIIWQ